MTAFRPEPDTEYSKGPDSFSGAGRGRDAGPAGPSRALGAGILAGGLGGALLLAVAEFTPLLKIHSSARRAAIASVQTGSDHAYALIPIAVAAAVFSFAVWRTRNRLCLLAIGVLGLVGLLIALLRDLPSAQSTGLLVSATTNLILGKATPSLGFYLETLGAVLLLITAAAGLLFLAPPQSTLPPRRQVRRGSGPPGAAQGPLPD